VLVPNLTFICSSQCGPLCRLAVFVDVESGLLADGHSQSAGFAIPNCALHSGPHWLEQ